MVILEYSCDRHSVEDLRRKGSVASLESRDVEGQKRWTVQSLVLWRAKLVYCFCEVERPQEDLVKMLDQ